MKVKVKVETGAEAEIARFLRGFRAYGAVACKKGFLTLGILNAQRHLVITIEARRKSPAIVYSKYHAHVAGVGAGTVAQKARDLLARHIERGGRRITVDTRRDKRKSNARDLQSSRLVKCRAIGAAQQAFLAMVTINPARPHRMNNPTRGQIKTPRHHGAARGARSDPATRLLQLLIARGREDRTAHATACDQSLVRGVDNSVNAQPSDVGPHDRKRHAGSPL